MTHAAALADPAFLAPRRCLREPVDAIAEAAALLEAGVDAHLAGDRTAAAARFRAADLPEVRAWTESLWGSARANPDQPSYLRIRAVPGAPPHLPKGERLAERMPTRAEQEALIAHWGHTCAFCGIPVIHARVRERIRKAYPEVPIWGTGNASQHAALQCMWLQFDHVLPHARGGGSEPGNVVITCAPCNYGRWNRTLEEMGLEDPRLRGPEPLDWDGLERFR